MTCLGIRASSVDTETTSKASANVVCLCLRKVRTQHVITRDQRHDNCSCSCSRFFQVKHKYALSFSLARSPSFGVQVLTRPSLCGFQIVSPLLVCGCPLADLPTIP